MEKVNIMYSEILGIGFHDSKSPHTEYLAEIQFLKFKKFSNYAYSCSGITLDGRGFYFF